MINSISLQTFLGELWISELDGQISAVSFTKPYSATRRSPLLENAQMQLQGYFDKTRTQFDLPLLMSGTEFYNTVWRELCNIPYGVTCSYGELASKIGRPKAARAVGMANHNNPIMIIVPCHRVIGANGMLTGYAGGLNVKEKLLQLESTNDIQIQ